jgi:hypothetical protein
MADQNLIYLDWRRDSPNVLTINSLFSTGVPPHLVEKHWATERTWGYESYRIFHFPLFVGEYKREKGGSESLIFWRYDDAKDKHKIDFADLPSEVQEKVRSQYRTWKSMKPWFAGDYNWL